MFLPFSGGVDALLLLIIALVLDACIGDAGWLSRYVPGPALLAGRVTARLDRRLNRIDRTDGVRRARGALITLALLVVGVAAGFLLSVVAREVPAGGVLELVVLTRCLTLRLPWGAMGRAVTALDQNDMETARAAIGPLTDRQLWSLDNHGIVRAGVEGAARALTHGVMAPALAYALLGMAGLLGWAMLDGVARTIGHATPRYQHFGALARRLSSLIAWPAALLVVLVILLAALFIPRASAARAWRDVWAAGRHPWGADTGPAAALAGAIDLSIAGPRREGDMVIKEPWLGTGRARAVPRDLRVAMALYAVSTLIAVLLLCAGAIAVAPWV